VNRIDRTLESELQQAFVRGETQRLARFAHWCASQTVGEGMPDNYLQALELARQRAEGEIDPKRFASRAEWLLGQFPLAAAVIGLKHGAPNAMRLLAIAATLNAGPLTAAIQASRNHRGYERLLAQRELEAERVVGGPMVVGLPSAAVLSDAGAPPTVSEAKCAERQFTVWRHL
jgi:hypothetical protein